MQKGEETLKGRFELAGEVGQDLYEAAERALKSHQPVQ